MQGSWHRDRQGKIGNSHRLVTVRFDLLWMLELARTKPVFCLTIEYSNCYLVA